MTTAIECLDLSKRYGNSKVYALKNLTLRIQLGEVYGFLGPNGAGKSTTIRTLMNFIQPTDGKATILGLDIIKDSVQIKQSIGYLSSDITLYRKLTGRQFLDYMEGLQPATSKTFRNDLCQRLKVDLDKQIGELSRGNRQKLAIIQAFMHQPKILILDEPTSGLDPLMQEVFYELVREAKQRGDTVFVSSHILSEVQKMCDRVGIIREGRLVIEKSIADMTSEAAHTFDITFGDELPVAKLKAIKGLVLANRHENTATIHLRGDLAPLFAELAKHKVTQISAQNLDLEEVFMRFYKDPETQK